MCDAHIVAEGQTFEAHRVALTCGSAFFEGAFTSGLAESESARVVLSEMPAITCHQALTFLYTGECEVYEADLPELLTAATFLQMSSLVTAVSTTLEKRLTTTSCLPAWDLAATHGLEGLMQAAKEHALRHFGRVAAGEAFGELPHARLLELLSDERLTTTHEVEVHDAVIAWAKAQLTPPAGAALSSLLATVRYPLITREAFESRVVTEPLLQGVIGFQIISAAFVAGVYGPPVGRRRGFLPCFSDTLRSEHAVLRDGSTAFRLDKGGMVLSAEPIAAGSRIALKRIGGDPYVGVAAPVTATKPLPPCRVHGSLAYTVKCVYGDPWDPGAAGTLPSIESATGAQTAGHPIKANSNIELYVNPLPSIQSADVIAMTFESGRLTWFIDGVKACSYGPIPPGYHFAVGSHPERDPLDIAIVDFPTV